MCKKKKRQRKKGTATKLQTQIVAVFFPLPANCTLFYDYLDNSLASISPVTGKLKKGRLHCNTLFTVYYLYIYIYIFIYIYIYISHWLKS